MKNLLASLTFAAALFSYPANAETPATTEQQKLPESAIDKAVKHCVDMVHHLPGTPGGPMSDPDGVFVGFDAFYNPATGKVENNAVLVADQEHWWLREPLFQFNKCMASQGHPLG